MGIRDYSTSAADNTAVNGQVVSDATNAANVDNIVREIMADLASFAADTPQLGTVSTVSASWTVSGAWTVSGNWSFTGNISIGGAPTFTGSPDFSGAQNKPTIRSDLGLGAAAVSEFATNAEALTGTSATLSMNPANTKHVLDAQRRVTYDPAAVYVNETSNRAMDTEYTNSDAYARQVLILTNNNDSNGQLYVDGVFIAEANNQTGVAQTVSVLVPASSTYEYRASFGSHSFTRWTEFKAAS